MTPDHLLEAHAVARLDPERQHALLQLRPFYRQTGGVFSKAELDRLRFVRWLYQIGRLAS